ncbi:GTP cyclohydrolase II [Patescibacteria group bacterium]|nr:GTP cyclohydrolase II [Patescibacteria group bacterium]
MSEDHHCPPDKSQHCVKLTAIGNLPTRFGSYQVAAFYNNQDDKEHAAFIHGDVCNKEDVPVRLHSECLTGDTIGSLRCDCRDQLEESLKMIAKMEFGLILYLRQEGRGIGFNNKIKAYQLQDEGYDTVEANKMLGFADDERDYDIAAHMIKLLTIKSVKLITNNEKKIKDLKRHGIKITGRIPLEIPPNKFNKFYLETKRDKSGHLLAKLDEQIDGAVKKL